MNNTVTSAAALAKVSTPAFATMLQRSIAEALTVMPDGLNADEIANLQGLDTLNVRPCLTKLGERGLIRKTDSTREGDRGNQMHVWVLA